MLTQGSVFSFAEHGNHAENLCRLKDSDILFYVMAVTRLIQGVHACGSVEVDSGSAKG